MAAPFFLRSDQIEDVRWIVQRLQHNRAALAAHDTGTGKTAVAIEAATDLGAERILVLLPKIAMLSWPRELAKWDRRRLPVFIIGRDGDVVPAGFRGWVLVNYERIVNRQKVLLDSILRQSWPLAIVDECHMISNPDAQRTQLLYGRKPRLVDRLNRILLMSGTPMRSSAADLWSHLAVLFPGTIRDDATGKPMDRITFRDRFCVVQQRTLPNGVRVETIVGGRNEDELRRRIAPVHVHRTREQVLAMSPLWVHPAFIETDDDAGMQLEGLAAQMGVDLSLGDDALLAQVNLRDPALTHLMQAAALQRVPDIIVTLRELVGTDSILRGKPRKVIVPAHHHSVMDALVNGLTNEGVGIVALRGNQKLDERQHYVDQFQRNPLVQVAVCQLQVAATAISLTSATDVVFSELSWSAADNAQVIARAYRLGQTNPVVVQLMLGTSKIELAQARIVAARLESIIRIAPDAVSARLAGALRDGVDEYDNDDDWMASPSEAAE